MKQSRSWEGSRSSANQEIYGTRKFITTLSRIRHLSLCWATAIQSTSTLFLDDPF